MRAIILAAGAGSRLWPYTITRPKPMVPVAGRPILAWVLDGIAQAGIDEVQIVVGYKASRIQSYVEDGADWGLDVSYVGQELLLGTAAALGEALQAGGVPDQALVLGGDNLVDQSLVGALVGEGPDHLAVARTTEPSKYGVVELAGDRQVAGIQEKPPLSGEALVSTGVALLGREVLEAVPKLVEAGMLGLAHVLDHIAQDGPGLGAVVDAGRWRDAVYPWDLLTLSEEMLRHGSEDHLGIHPDAEVEEGALVRGPVTVGRGATIEAGATVRGPVAVGANARIEAGAMISASLLMEDAAVGTGAIVERSVVGDGTRVHGGAILARGHAVADTGDEVHKVPDLGALVGEGCIIEGGAVLLPGTLVGNNARVRAGARARGRIAEGAEVT